MVTANLLQYAPSTPNWKESNNELAQRQSSLKLGAAAGLSVLSPDGLVGAATTGVELAVATAEGAIGTLVVEKHTSSLTSSVGMYHALLSRELASQPTIRNAVIGS